MEIKNFTESDFEFNEIARLYNLVSHDDIEHVDDIKDNWAIKDKDRQRDRLFLCDNNSVLGYLGYAQGRDKNCRNCYFNIVLDPHSAIGYGAFDKINIDGNNVVLATAHPSKFPDAIKKAIDIKSDLPKELMFVMGEKENYDIIDNDVEKIKQYIKEKIL